MDVVLFTILMPELILIIGGFILVAYCLIMNGDWERFYRHYKPRGSQVSSGYWGRYTELPLKKTDLHVNLPKISKIRESIKYEPDWTG